ncbi:MAG: dipeptide ABC transporter ATP-binding protein [Deltaproteobacteria bacterium]|nr:dipeptide ABC transporter ATP-binding protein [Deltaproteobacteria bacterium]MDH4007265.1 dipeptide ABC transporter ATP-binding protein [Desulfuromonadales bacterium]
MPILLSVENLHKAFKVSAKRPGAPKLRLKAVDGVSFEIEAGETLGLVGESGCGKSTIGKLLLRLIEPDDGIIRFADKSVTGMPKRELTALRRDMQMIFQDPFSSLNPRMRVGEIIGEPLVVHDLVNGKDPRNQVLTLMDKVGLSAEHYDRYPHEFSGGQRQRIGIARTLAVQPRLVVADEPVSALDLSIQAQIVNLLKDLQEEFGLTYLFISHDLGVIEHVCDRVAVMYLGRIVEIASAEDLYDRPRHPYTEALMNAVPVPDPNRHRQKQVLSGEIPSPIDPPTGCHFHPRCPYAKDICQKEYPVLSEQLPGHKAACHFSAEVGDFRTTINQDSTGG